MLSIYIYSFPFERLMLDLIVFITDYSLYLVFIIRILRGYKELLLSVCSSLRLS